MALEHVGKYEIRGKLGAGAMGVVLDAWDPVIERRAALKILKKPPVGDAEGAEGLARFKREAQAAGRLTHPNIVAVYDYGEDGENAWIAMELVEGGSLKDILDRGDRMQMAEVARVMEQTLAGLHYSHQRGVVHRDIKPANLMLAADRTIKIADFGIARLENSSMTQVGTVMGTPSYMAPEQLRGEPVDSRADIWAAGVMLYQLLTGEKPFEGGYTAVMHKAIHTDPTPPSSLAVTAPRAFDAVISKALAKRPEDRFATAGDFAEAIKAALNAPAAAAPMPMGGDPDATIVAGGAPRQVTPTPGPAKTVAPPGAPKKGAPVLLIGGGVAALGIAGAAAFFLLGTGTTPAPPTPAPPAQIALQQPPAPVLAPPAQPAPPAPALLTPSAPVPAPATPPAFQPPPAPLTLAPQAPVAVAPQPTASPPPAAPFAPPVQPAAPLLQQPQPAQPPPLLTQPLLTPPPQQAPAQQAPVLQAPAAPPPLAVQPSAPPQQLAVVQPPRLDFAAAAAAAAAAPPCGLIAASATDRSLTLFGVARRGDDAVIRRTLAARDIPLSAANLNVQAFDGPYCPAFDVLRPVLAPPEAAPRVGIIGSLPLIKGQLLRFDVTMPDWPSHLYVAYFMASGEVAHLVPSAAHAARATVRLGEPRAGFPGWEVDEPFGTDLLVAVASERPLFGANRPLVEPQGDYLAALSLALNAARQAGNRVVIRPQVIQTSAR